MVKINDTTTFPNTAPALTDHFPGTDVSNTANDAAGETVTFTLQAVMDLFESNMTVPSSVSSAYRTSTILSSTSTGEGAALIGSEDAGTYFTATTVEGILQEIGAALPTGTIVGTSDTQTLTNKTLTAPQVNQLNDTNGNESITLTATASGVSYLDVASGTTGNDVVLTGSGETNTGISIQASGTGNVTVGPIVIDGDATVGAGQDNYVLTYNHSAGTWGPEASGGGTVNISGTPANNQFAVWTDASTIEGISALTYDATSFTISADLDPNADGTINLGNTTNRFASISVDSIDLNGTTFSGTTLADPGTDAGLFWDDSAATTAYWTAGTGLEFSGTNLQIDATVAQTSGATFTGAIEFSGTTHEGIKLNNLTTTQRDALTAAAGMFIYNTSTNAVNFYNGSAWTALATTASGIANVADDTTPQLGGNLDVNGQAIVSAAGGNIPITPDTTGAIILDGISWPTADGAANTALTTNGSGALSFTNLSTRTETLTNKTIDSANNTLTVDLAEATVTGTTAQFNTALSDGSFATLAGTETLTNKTVNLTSNTLSGTLAQFNTALSDGNFTGQQHLYIPAAAMIARTTSGAAAGSTELATNDVMVESFDFDTAADEHVQFSLQMPKNWNEGTLVAQFIWSHPSTTTNFGVTWAIQAVAFADGDAGDTAFGTAVLVDDTGGTTDDIYISPESGAITVAGTPGAEEYVVFQVYRDVSDANDTLAVDARLHGVKIHWTSDAITAD